jgi:phage-related protein (TIGR01555 family)
MKWLRSKLRAWLGVLDSATPAPSPDGFNVSSVALAKSAENPATLSEFQKALVRIGEQLIIPRKVEPPKLPPGVRNGFTYDRAADAGHLGEPIALDDAANAPMWAYVNQANCGLGFPGYPYLSELAQRSEYRAPTETIAAEATREWIDITVKGKASKKKRKARGEKVDEPIAKDALPKPPKPAKTPQPDGTPEADDAEGDETEDKIEAMEAALEEFKVRDHFRRLSEIDGFNGRSQLYIDVDTGRMDRNERDQLPLVVDPQTIPKGSLKGFQPIEPIWTSPYSYNTNDPTLPSFYKPTAWFVMGRRVHASRLLTFISREVPDMLKPAYNFGGLSLSQLMEPYVFQWLRTRNSVSDLIYNFSIIVLKTDMAAVLADKGGAAGAKAGLGFFDRLKLFTNTRSNNALMTIDKNREELEQIAVPLSGLEKLQAQAQEHMAAPSHIPLVKLTGITPDGLNASSEGEIQVWYDWIRSYQIAFYAKHLKHVLDVIQLHLFGAIDDSIGYEFKPLSSPTVKELSEIRKANAETDAAYVDKGVISPEEVRERVSSDPQSGYDNLHGPAPTPPVLSEAEHGAGLEEKGKQADHERAGETAEEAHTRALELEKTKAASKKAA